MKTPKGFVVVKSEEVTSWWECPECGEGTHWTFEDVQDAGSPVCGDCDMDMELKSVFIKNPY